MIPRPSALARVAHLTEEESRPTIPRPSALARVAHIRKEKSPPMCLRPSAVARVAHFRREKPPPVCLRPSAVARVAHFRKEKPPSVCLRPSAISRAVHSKEDEPPLHERPSRDAVAREVSLHEKLTEATLGALVHLVSPSPHCSVIASHLTRTRASSTLTSAANRPFLAPPQIP